MKTDFRTVDEYLAAQPEGACGALARVRAAIRKALPGSDEVISYKIPTYKLLGKAVLYFAGWKRHYSLYPASQRLLAAFEEDLTPYVIDKSTIRFPLDAPVPAALIGCIAKFRVRELAERQKVLDDKA